MGIRLCMIAEGAVSLPGVECAVVYVRGCVPHSYCTRRGQRVYAGYRDTVCLIYLDFLCEQCTVFNDIHERHDTYSALVCLCCIPKSSSHSTSCLLTHASSLIHTYALGKDALILYSEIIQYMHMVGVY